MPAAFKSVDTDVLTSVLSTLRIRGKVFCVNEFSAPWALELPAAGFAHFHVIERGGALLQLKDKKASVPLASGDLVIVPHGQGHTLSDSASTRPVLLEKLLKKGKSNRNLLQYGGGGTETHVICGSFQFEHAATNPLLSMLPPLLHLPAYSGRIGEWLELTLRLLVQEARTQQQGSSMVIARLTEIIFVQAVRAWMASQPNNQGKWIGALRHPQIGAALGHLHRDPSRHWTVATLADAVGMSRSPFAAKFTALVGEPPLSYLTNWRLHLAATLLGEEDITVNELAEKVGYESAASFSKAFRRRFGKSPTEFSHLANIHKSK